MANRLNFDKYKRDPDAAIIDATRFKLNLAVAEGLITQTEAKEELEKLKDELNNGRQ